MRYLLPLLFMPSVVFAACAPGVNLGHWPISAGNPVCSPFSGSSLGGCFAYCEGSTSGGACVQLPNADPPTRGPYFSNGKECEYKNGGDSNGGTGNSGGNQSGTDGTHTGVSGLVDVGKMMIGDKYVTDLGLGFNAVSNNVRASSEKIIGEIKKVDTTFKNFASDISPFIKESSQDLKRITNNTANLANAIGQGNETLNAQLMKINQSRVLDHSFWLDEMNKDREKSQYYYSNIRDLLSHMDYVLEFKVGGGGGGNGNGGGTQIPETLINSIYSIDGGVNQLNEILGGDYSPYMKGMMDSNKLLTDISGKLDKLGEGSGGGEGGDKPCKGPLCDFTKPSGSSGSALSKVFSAESVDEVKKQVENKDAEIQSAMNDVKSVFAPEQLTITGAYNNDYHDINGVRVDLSGKSNMELFFNSGSKMAIWFLAVLLAFSILMGGRKNA